MKEVFAAHPGAKKIWVVKGMPFLNETEAKNYALSEKADIEEVERPVDEEETEFEKVVGSVAPEITEERKALIEHAKQLKVDQKEAKSKAKHATEDKRLSPDYIVVDDIDTAANDKQPASIPPAAKFEEGGN